MAENEEKLKFLLMKVKDKSEKTGLKPNIQKTKIMASGPITPWQIDGETMETVKPRSPTLQADVLPSEPPGKPEQGIAYSKCTTNATNY